MNDQGGDKPANVANEEPWQREETWQSLAIAAAVLLVVGFVMASIWVIVAPDDFKRLLRVQIAAPFGVFGGATVTFFTIVWRGRISKRQADAQLIATNLQREQIDKLALQIAATEENTLADLLQRGAHLIAESSKKAHVAAGVAILQSVAEAPNGKFAVQSMDLLADYVQDKYDYGVPDNMVGAAIDALQSGVRLERYSNRSLVFDARSIDVARTNEGWRIISGVRSIRYFGGLLEQMEQSKFPPKTRYTFTEIKLENGRLDLTKGSYNKCRFDSCEILAASVPSIRRNRFEGCDFSGAKIDNPRNFPDLRSEGNYYSAEDEPVTRRLNPDWSRVLVVHDFAEFEDLSEDTDPSS